MSMSMFMHRWRQDPSCLPWWWFVPYLSLTSVFLLAVVFLVSYGYTLAVAVGAVVTVSTVAVSALSRMARFVRAHPRSV